jgi:hypothetical protein
MRCGGTVEVCREREWLDATDHGSAVVLPSVKVRLGVAVGARQDQLRSDMLRLGQPVRARRGTDGRGVVSFGRSWRGGRVMMSYGENRIG